MEPGGKFVMAAFPFFLPGGKAVLFTHVAGLRLEDMRIAALSLESGEVSFLVEGAASGH